MEAVRDDKTALSYHALIGTRKQLVSDVEQIFGHKVLHFLEQKGYAFEAEYVRVIRNWRRACDERGITHEERSKYNREFIAYIVDDLMPWHRESDKPDFSLLEVNRYVAVIDLYAIVNATHVKVLTSYIKIRHHYIHVCGHGRVV